MKFSRKTDYGILFLSALKKSYSNGGFLALKDVAKTYNLPFAYLEKIAISFKKYGILEAKPGVGGGYRLIRNPKNIRLQEVINIFEEPEIVRCLKPNGKSCCDFINSCPTQKGWFAFNKKVSKIFEQTKISEVI